MEKRIVDIAPFINLLDAKIATFGKTGNGLGYGIFSSLRRSLINLPVLDEKKYGNSEQSE